MEMERTEQGETVAFGPTAMMALETKTECKTQMKGIGEMSPSFKRENGTQGPGLTFLLGQ